MLRSKLIDLIYEAAIVPERWTNVLDTGAEFAQAIGGTLFTIGNPTAFAVRSEALAAPWDAFISENWSAKNLRLQRVLERDITFFVHDDELFTDAEKQASEWYTGFCRQWEFGGSLGAVIDLPTSGKLMMTFERHTSAGPYSSADVDGFNAIRADLGRAVTLTARLSFQQHQNTTSILQAIGLAAAVVAPNKRLLAANGLFEALIPNVIEDRSSRVNLKNRQSDRLLAAAMDSLAQDRWEGIVASIPLPAAEGQKAGVLHVLPVRGIANDILYGGAALLVISTLGPQQTPSHQLIKELFDLTAAESKVAAQLVKHGGRHEAIAQELGVSRETIRSQTKAIYQKLNLTGSPDLISMLSNLTLIPGRSQVLPPAS